MKPPSLKYAIPILQATADEGNEELQDLWSRLLAAAMDPNRRDALRQSFVQAVKQMDPIDALVLKAIRDNGGATWNTNGRDVIARKLDCSHDEVMVSFALSCEPNPCKPQRRSNGREQLGRDDPFRVQNLRSVCLES